MFYLNKFLVLLKVLITRFNCRPCFKKLVVGLNKTTEVIYYTLLIILSLCVCLSVSVCLSLSVSLSVYPSLSVCLSVSVMSCDV